MEHADPYREQMGETRSSILISSGSNWFFPKRERVYSTEGGKRGKYLDQAKVTPNLSITSIAASRLPELSSKTAPITASTVVAIGLGGIMPLWAGFLMMHSSKPLAKPC